MLSSSISRIVFGLAITVFAVSANSSQAGVIPTGTYSATGDGNGSATVTDIGPPIDIELITVSKAFTGPGPIDIVFDGVHANAAAPGTVSYIVTEGVTNNTSETWISFTEMLGTGTGDTFVEGSPVTFGAVDSTFTHPAFTTQSVTSSEIDYSGGSVAPGQAISFSFSIVVPDPTFRDEQTPAYNFTLREGSTAGLSTPEPSALVLLTLGACGLFLAARRRRTA